jgi:hypothetical protein
MSPVSLRTPVLAFLIAALLAVFPAVASADFPQLRLTHFGADGDVAQEAGFVAAAFNTKTNQYLIVYEAGPTADDNFWSVYGQFLDTAGNPVGGQFNISAPTANQLCSYDPPNVAYSEPLNQFLVSWNEGTTLQCDDAIYAQRIAADGTLIGTPSQRVSATGYDDIETSQPVYNPSANEWVIGWMGVGPTTTGQEIFSQRLDASGNEVGTDDQRLTHFDAVPGGSADDAMGVAVDPATSRYLFVIRAIDPSVTSHDEIYGRVMTADGSTIGADHFRSSRAAITNPNGNANPPNVIFDPSARRFLVVWTADEMGGSMVDNEYEVWVASSTPAPTCSDSGISASPTWGPTALRTSSRSARVSASTRS